MVATTMESQAPAELIPRINFPADQLHLKMQEMFDNNRGNGNSSTSVDMAKFQGAAEQLDYNMPLLSVRRYRSEGDQWKTSKKVWKLSAELSKEPLRLPGSVPFEWERTPGQPKLLRPTEAPSPMPSTSSLSDNTNHTDNVHLETAPSPSSSQLPPGDYIHDGTVDSEPSSSSSSKRSWRDLFQRLSASFPMGVACHCKRAHRERASDKWHAGGGAPNRSEGLRNRKRSPLLTFQASLFVSLR